MVYKIIFSEYRVAYCDKNLLLEVYYKNHEKLRYSIMNMLYMQTNYVKIIIHNISRYKWSILLNHPDASVSEPVLGVWNH